MSDTSDHVYHVDCPTCGNPVLATAEWLSQNDRVYCGTCCKAFPVMVKEQEEPEEF